MAANLPDRKPAPSETIAQISRITPNLMVDGMLPPVMPSSISEAMIVGIRISRMPSTATSAGASRLAFLYSRIDLPSVRRTCFGLSGSTALRACAIASSVLLTCSPSFVLMTSASEYSGAAVDGVWEDV